MHVLAIVKTHLTYTCISDVQSKGTDNKNATNKRVFILVNDITFNNTLCFFKQVWCPKA